MSQRKLFQNRVLELDSLLFKMGNYMTKLSRAGKKQVVENARKHSRTNPEGAAFRANKTEEGGNQLPFQISL